MRKEKRANGTAWVFRWSEGTNGQRRHHKEVIGTLKEFSSESAASRAAEGLRFKLNQDKRQLSLPGNRKGRDHHPGLLWRLMASETCL
jgi:hypothetical protein